MAKDPKGKKRPALAISFRTYVRGHPREDSPAGDFIADANADKSFPEIAAWKDLRSYLYMIGAADAAMVSARSVWRRYNISQREHSKDA
jgi:protein involved in sex pheromone biosynthesis